MNTNTDRNKETLKTPIQDAQGRWHELLSPTQVLTGQQQQQNLHGHREQRKQTTTKKKSHGNRKEQHKRRRLRRQQQKLNLIRIDNDSEQISKCAPEFQQNKKSNKKRKRQETNEDNRNVSRSLSQLSISQENNARKKRSKATNNQSNNELFNGINDHHQQEHHRNDIQKCKPHYLQVSDQLFIQMLSNTIQDGDKQIVQCLNTNEKLQFIREMTELTNNLQYIDLQRHLWQDYYNLGMKEGLWAPRLSKYDAQQLNTCRTYGFPKQLIEKRQRTIESQLQRTINELQEYLIKLGQYAQQWQPSFDPNLISHAINECVKKGQQRLRQEFDYRRKMLELNSNDRQAIAKFYDLKPNEEQKQLSKMIWQTTADELKANECEEILRKRIYLQRLPSGIDKIINQSIDPIQLLLSDPILDKDRRASLISCCSKTITQYKLDLLVLNLDIIQTMKRGHEQLLLDLLEKLSQSDCTGLMQQTIKNRQQTMRKRHEVYLNHQLNTFFDEAPTVVSNE